MKFNAKTVKPKVNPKIPVSINNATIPWGVILSKVLIDSGISHLLFSIILFLVLVKVFLDEYQPVPIILFNLGISLNLFKPTFNSKNLSSKSTILIVFDKKSWTTLLGVG